MRASRRVVNLLLVLVMLSGAFGGGSGVDPVQAASPNIVISQVYGGGGNSGAQYKNDFIELFNLGSTPVNIKGWSVQYAPSGSTTWQVTPLYPINTDPDLYLQPGQYLLIEEGGGASGMSLPEPHIDSSIILNQSAGKIALVSSITQLKGGQPISSEIIDVVGYGGVEYFEFAPTPQLSNITAAIRKTGSCSETDNNFSDFVIATPSPRTSNSPVLPCVQNEPPTVDSTLPADNATGIELSTNLTVNFSEDVTLAENWFEISCTISGPHSAVVSGGPQSFFLNPYFDFSVAETCTVTVFVNKVTDLDGAAMGSDYSWSFITKGGSNPHVSVFASPVLFGGETVTYTIEYGNDGVEPAASIHITDTLPVGFFYESDDSGFTPVFDGSQIAWNVGDLAPGASGSFHLVALAPVSTILNHGTPVNNQVEIGPVGFGNLQEDDDDQVNGNIYQIVPISVARAGESGDTYAVEGRVTVKPGMFHALEWELQDETGGISAYGVPIPTPAMSLGDKVRLVANWGNYRGQEQLVDPWYYFLNLESGSEPAPRKFSTRQVAAGDSEGWLIQLEGVISGLTSCSTSKDYEFWLDDGSGAAHIYIDKETGVDICSMGAQNDTPLRLTGFSTQYDTDFEVKPRQVSDVQLLSPYITKSAIPWITPGDIFTYTITVNNNLGYALDDLVISDTLPADSTFATVSDGGSFEPDLGIVSWSFPSLGDKAAASFRFAVTAGEVSGVYIQNKLYAVSASNFITPTFGIPVQTHVGDSLHIPQVQGPGNSSPLLGMTVQNICGTVTLRKLNNTSQVGFFMQDPSDDGLPETSQGIYVASSSAVSVNENVCVNARVSEIGGVTQFTNVTVIKPGTTGSIPVTTVHLPVGSSTELERYEGMLVHIPEDLTVSQNYFQDETGQLTLSVGGRLHDPTNGDGLGISLEENLRRMIVLDDGLTNMYPNPVPYYHASTNLLRQGDIVNGVTGVIDYGSVSSSLSYYLLQPLDKNAITFNHVNLRTTTPEDIGGSLKVASFNVLNYFNGDGMGGGFPTSRGATNTAEFTRQRDKMIAAILALNADVIGLMEMENDGTGPLSAIQDLVGGLNAVAGTGTYAFVAEPASGSDEIKVSLIYDTTTVSPVGEPQNFQVADAPGYGELYDRPPLAQTFAQTSTGEKFSVIVNHFKSKGCAEASGTDLDAGQGCWNAKRILQAQQMLEIVAQIQSDSGDPDVLVIGDLNSYGGEDPIQTLIDGGMVNEVANFVPPELRYSYTFDGQSGYLDQALATPNLSAQISGVTFWQINADEPKWIDYNTERKNLENDLYAPTAYRASDHDPVLIGLNLGVVAGFTHNAPQPAGLAVQFTNTTTGLEPVTYIWDFGDNTTEVAGANPVHVFSQAGDYTVTLTATNEHTTDEASTIVHIVAPLATGFTHNTPVILGDEVIFNNHTLGYGPISFQWDFGDNSALVSEASPRHIYAHAGTYLVKLTATNPFQSAESSANVTVLTPGALKAFLSVNPVQDVPLGGEVTYTIALTNTGETVVDGILITDTLPAGVTFVGWVVQSGASNAGDKLTWEGQLAAGSGLTIAFTVQVDLDLSLSSKTLTNTLEYVSSTGGSGLIHAEFTIRANRKIFLPIIKISRE